MRLVITNHVWEFCYSFDVYYNRGYCGLKVGFKPNLRSLDHIFLCVWWISGKWAGFHFQGLGSRPDRVTVVFDKTHNSPSATLHLEFNLIQVNWQRNKTAHFWWTDIQNHFLFLQTIKTVTASFYHKVKQAPSE